MTSSSTVGGVAGLRTFREHLLSAAGEVLSKTHPEYSTAYAAIGNGADPQSALRALLAMPIPHFAPWAELLTRQVDVEFGLRRVDRSARLLAIQLDQRTLDHLGITAGDWVDQTLMAAHVHISGALERAIALGKQTHRKLIRPNVPSPQFSEQSAIALLVELRNHNKTVRDPVAHGGGYIEILSTKGFVGLAAASGQLPPLDHLTSGLTDRQPKWARDAFNARDLLVQGIDVAFRAFDGAVPWRRAIERVSARKL